MNELLRVLPFRVMNAAGGRGFENGVLVFDCPACGDRKARGYVSIYSRRGGCFRASCELHGGMPIRDYLQFLVGAGIMTRDSAADVLRIVQGAEPPTKVVRDFPYRKPFVKLPGRIRKLTASDLPESWAAVRAEWVSRFGFCWVETIYGGGILIPVTYMFQPCFYTVRLSGGGYMAATRGESSHGKSECLFGYDFLPHDSPVVVVVESAQDAVAVMERHKIPAVALLGSSMSYEQRRLLVSTKPRSVIVALDADAQDKSAFIVSELGKFLPAARVGTWVGAKDAAQGGVLRVV